ncbi:MAG: Proline iminopeptidase [Candidatus Anoxychlamydiales bacterium]|nr:Proline iminopeptidase [Candidatus Anoxychlamydiales bacterium]
MKIFNVVLIFLFFGIIFSIFYISKKKFKNIQKNEYFITVPGGLVWVVKYSSTHCSAKTPLLIVHGGPGMAHNYLLSLSQLAHDRPVIFYDQLGCGRSEKPNDNSLWNLSRFTQELKCVIEQLHLKEIHLLGHSWGGTIVSEYALTNPSNLRSLILASPYLSTKIWINDANALRSQLSDNVQIILKKGENSISKKYNEAIMIYYKKHFCRLNPWPKVLSSLLNDLHLPAYQIMWGSSDFIMNGNLKDFDNIENLSKIFCPVLLTCGRYDEATPSTMEYCLSKLKKGNLKVFEQSSHVAMLEETKNYLNFLKLYLNKIEPLE